MILVEVLADLICYGDIDEAPIPTDLLPLIPQDEEQRTRTQVSAMLYALARRTPCGSVGTMSEAMIADLARLLNHEVTL